MPSASKPDSFDIRCSVPVHDKAREGYAGYHRQTRHPYGESINEDKAALKSRIFDSLKRLEDETLIQKNGEEYDFLTNAERMSTSRSTILHIRGRSSAHHPGHHL